MKGKKVYAEIKGQRVPLVELDRTKPLHGVPIPREIVDKVTAEFNELSFMTWEKGDSIGKEDIPFIAQSCGMVGRADLDQEVVYNIISTIYSHYDDYKDKHPIMKMWTSEQAVSAIGSPVHPGAIKYFRARGLWKAEQETLNQKLLAKPRR